MMRRRYRSREQQRAYEAWRDLWVAGPSGGRESELFKADGSPREHGARSRVLFWQGFNGERPFAIVRGSAAAAIYRAGADCADHARAERRRIVDNARELETIIEREPAVAALFGVKS